MRTILALAKALAAAACSWMIVRFRKCCGLQIGSGVVKAGQLHLGRPLTRIIQSSYTVLESVGNGACKTGCGVWLLGVFSLEQLLVRSVAEPNCQPGVAPISPCRGKGTHLDTCSLLTVFLTNLQRGKGAAAECDVLPQVLHRVDFRRLGGCALSFLGARSEQSCEL